ncbi:hypothetical protein ACHAWF_005440 [Thalassiosira exigua]
MAADLDRIDLVVDDESIYSAALWHVAFPSGGCAEGGGGCASGGGCGAGGCGTGGGLCHPGCVLDRETARAGAARGGGRPAVGSSSRRRSCSFAGSGCTPYPAGWCSAHDVSALTLPNMEREATWWTTARGMLNDCCGAASGIYVEDVDTEAEVAEEGEAGATTIAAKDEVDDVAEVSGLTLGLPPTPGGAEEGEGRSEWRRGSPDVPFGLPRAAVEDMAAKTEPSGPPSACPSGEATTPATDEAAVAPAGGGGELGLLLRRKANGAWSKEDIAEAMRLVRAEVSKGRDKKETEVEEREEVEVGAPSNYYEGARDSCPTTSESNRRSVDSSETTGRGGSSKSSSSGRLPSKSSSSSSSASSLRRLLFKPLGKAMHNDKEGSKENVCPRDRDERKDDGRRRSRRPSPFAPLTSSSSNAPSKSNHASSNGSGRRSLFKSAGRGSHGKGCGGDTNDARSRTPSAASSSDAPSTGRSNASGTSSLDPPGSHCKEEVTAGRRSGGSTRRRERGRSTDATRSSRRSGRNGGTRERKGSDPPRGMDPPS